MRIHGNGIRESFLQSSRQGLKTEILSIPLNHLDSRDTLIWKENKSQQFSVKSAYQLALRMQNGHVVEHSSARQDQNIWNQVWSLNVFLKVRVFLWRACSNCLPTGANLNQRRVQINPTVSYAATCYGSALLLEMFGLWSKVKSKNALTRCKTSFCCFNG